MLKYPYASKRKYCFPGANCYNSIFVTAVPLIMHVSHYPGICYLFYRWW